MFDPLIGEIRHLESQVSNHRALMAELGIPSLDGAPESWLVRYCTRLRESVPLVTEERRREFDEMTVPEVVPPVEAQQPKPRKSSTRSARQRRQAGVAACGGVHPTVAGVTCDKAVGHPGSHGNYDSHLFWLTPEQPHPGVDRIPPSVDADTDTDADPDDPFGELVDTASETQLPTASNNAVTDTAAEPEQRPSNPFAWADAAWSEASSRETGARFNVWTGRGRKGRCVGRWTSLKPAIAAAFEHRPARVFDGFIELKDHRTTNPATLIRWVSVCAELAKVTRELDLVVVLERAGGIRLPKKRVQILIAAVVAGELEWKGHKVKLVQANLELAGNKPNWFVRRIDP